MAGWRMASLLVKEDGPFDGFAKFRDLFWPEEGPIENPIGKVLTCVWCTSVWTCLLTAAVWFLLSHTVVVILAAMAIPCWADRYANRQ